MTGHKTRVAVVFGGRSSEHAISCVSAGSVLMHLDRARFDVIPVGVSPAGAWVLGTGEPAELLPPLLRSNPDALERAHGYRVQALHGGITQDQRSRVIKRLREEESQYRNINEAHRQHFEAMGVPLGSVGVAAPARPGVLDGLALYHSAVDLPIARLLPDQDATSLPAAAVAAAP